MYFELRNFTVLCNQNKQKSCKTLSCVINSTVTDVISKLTNYCSIIFLFSDIVTGKNICPCNDMLSTSDWKMICVLCDFNLHILFEYSLQLYIKVLFLVR